MSWRKSLPIVLVAAASSPALGADPIFTEPVGFVKLGNTEAGNPVDEANPTGPKIPAVEANTDVRLVVPLERSLEFSGAVSSASTSTIQVSGSPNWSTNQWTPGNGDSYCVVVTSGPEDGLRALITSHTADTLTLTVTSPGDLSEVASSNTLEIRKCWTIASLFSGSDLSEDCRLFLFERTQTKINQLPKTDYIFAGGTWFLDDDDTFAVSDNVIIYPGEGIILRNGPTPIQTLIVFGDVPTGSARYELGRDGSTADDNQIGTLVPVPMTLAELQIPAVEDDLLFVFDNAAGGLNKIPATNYIFSGGNWFLNEEPFTQVTNTLELQPGQAYVYRRAASAPAVSEWSVPAP